jgi:hypothetical protein
MVSLPNADPNSSDVVKTFDFLNLTKQDFKLELRILTQQLQIYSQATTQGDCHKLLCL